MRIAVLGASGWLGGEIARAALARGHEVTAVARGTDRLATLEGAIPVTADATDPQELERVLPGHDAVVAAVTDRSTPDRSTIPRVARALLEAAPRAGVSRIVWVGGGGTLEAPNGERFVDQPGFPEQYRAEALAQGEALDLFRAAPASVHWTYLSPPAESLTPGAPRGNARAQAGDTPVVGSDGHSAITSGDLAVLLVDELEQDRFAGQRFTVGY